MTAPGSSSSTTSSSCRSDRSRSSTTPEDGGGWSRNPIYATLHESSYADGVATRWSSDRLLPDEVRDEGYFTAEHVFPWMWDEFATLRPQKAAAEILAAHTWPALFDADQLRRNEVPVAATIYVNDLYVERDFAEETAATIRGLRPWQTDEFDHNGLRAGRSTTSGKSTARSSPSTISTSRSRTTSSWSWSDRRAAARPPRCA